MTQILRENRNKHNNNNNNIDDSKLNSNDNNVGRHAPVDVRIAVIGNVDSGKSTMIGVLTSGERDDGRGYARTKILRHNHERENGRTSCSSQHIMGFSDKKKPIHQPVSIQATPKQKTQAWSKVFENSKNMVTFIDLAGHEKYLKTTISGLTGCFPDYAFIVVGANMGISKMTKEHIQVAIALNIPLFVVITKIDISPIKILKHTVKTLAKLLRSSSCNNKMPMIIRKKKEIKLLFEKDLYLSRICPIFCVSAVNGDNIDKLLNFLCQLKPRKPWKHIAREQYIDTENINNDNNNSNHYNNNNNNNNNDNSKYGELEIDETFAVKGVGIVVSGTVTAGIIFPNQHLFLGPFSDGSFKEIIIRTVHMKRTCVEFAKEGESCSISFRFVKRKEVIDRMLIRKGMVGISDENNKPLPVWGFTATILVLHHPTTINSGYQPVVHCGNIRQTATIMKMNKPRLRSGDTALVDMKFLVHPEYMHTNRAIIIREGNTKCIGKVIQLYTNYHSSFNQDFIKIEKKLKDNSINIDGFEYHSKDELRKLEQEMKILIERRKKEKKDKKLKNKIQSNNNENNNINNNNNNNNNDNQSQTETISANITKITNKKQKH